MIWEVTAAIPNWKPPSLNTYLAHHWTTKRKLKKETGAILSAYLKAAGAKTIDPTAPRFRTIDIAVRYPIKSRGKMVDPDNLLKVTLDALVTDGWLHDDSSQWCQFTVSVGRSADVKTVTTFLTLKEI